jgi:raffinose/stachyose/melibiose transport system substrate-binding protein
MLTTSPIGMFVNSAIYNPSTPIASQTFDSLQQDLTSANQKIAFMTGENAWSTMLWFSAIINSIPGGTALMQQYGGMTGQYVTDFSNPIWLQATTELQSYLQNNSTSNAIGATAADMLNTFMNNNAAIMPNGPWMMSQFDGTDKSNWGPNFDGSTVTSSAYPGNIMLGSDYTIGQYWISASASPDQIQAALAFIQFVYSGPELEMRMLAEGNWCPNYTPSANFWTQVASDPPLASYFKATQNVGTVGPRFDECCYGSVVSANGGDFANLLPDLITGKSTPQQFLDQLQAAEVAAQTAAGS